jgi:hypothetical protein
MTLAIAFTDLGGRLDRLQQSGEDLLWAITQGRPASEPHQAMADRYETAAIDVLELVQQAVAATSGGAPQPDAAPNLTTARHAIGACQRHYNDLLARFYAEALAWREDRERPRRGAGVEWSHWVAGVDDALAPIPAQLYDVAEALLRVWQELVEWISAMSVSSLQALEHERGAGAPHERAAAHTTGDV